MTNSITLTRSRATFLEFACWDHHVHGKGDHRMYDRAAQRQLAQHPEIAARQPLHGRCVRRPRGSERILAERPRRRASRGDSRDGRRCCISATRDSHTSRQSRTRWRSRARSWTAARTRTTSTWPEMPATRRWSASPVRASRIRRGSRKRKDLFQASSRARRRAVRHPGPLQHALQRRRDLVVRADLRAQP